MVSELRVELVLLLLLLMVVVMLLGKVIGLMHHVVGVLDDIADQFVRVVVVVVGLVCGGRLDHSGTVVAEMIVVVQD